MLELVNNMKLEDNLFKNQQQDELVFSAFQTNLTWCIHMNTGSPPISFMSCTSYPVNGLSKHVTGNFCCAFFSSEMVFPMFFSIKVVSSVVNNSNTQNIL